MKYIEYINELVRKKLSENDKVVLFGQNITAGSCLSGLTKKIKVKDNHLVINTPNSENSLTGIGFGMMLNNTSSILFLKQQDFLLLGIDQLVNTYNFIRRKNPNASFTIIPIIIDNGYQGLQSSFNNFSDICSIAKIKGFAITNKDDADFIINNHLISPGFRIIALSQRLFGEEITDLGKLDNDSEGNFFKYQEGNYATIVCFNFSLPYGIELSKKLQEYDKKASLFSVNSLTPINWGKIIEDVNITKRLVIIDDSKTENLPCYSMLSECLKKVKLDKEIVLKRDFSKDWLSPNLDKLEINYDDIVVQLL
ncbi:MAG: hypothetical protein Q7R52_04535 [archaeon]|nr:hypothetical protein [archaeon]